jgi:hypothetical protein
VDGAGVGEVELPASAEGPAPAPPPPPPRPPLWGQWAGSWLGDAGADEAGGLVVLGVLSSVVWA